MINLFLLGYKALVAFKQLPKKYDEIIDYIVIGTDKNVVKDYSDDIANEALDRGVKFYRRNDELPPMSLYSFAIGWRWIILDYKNLIVFHDSLLPKYRGFNPLVSALINGDSEIGITALKGDRIIDSGDIIKQWKTTISYPLKIQNAIEIVSVGYSFLLESISEMILNESIITSLPQNKELITYSVWRDENDYFINWNWNIDMIIRFIDAVGFPYQGARLRLEDGTIYKVYEAEIWSLNEVINPGYGKVFMKEDGNPIVVCRGGLLKLNDIRTLDNDKAKLPENLRYRFI